MKSRTGQRRNETGEGRPIAIQLPLRWVETFGTLEERFFELCVEAGQQVLAAMMEEDRERWCGPKWHPHPGRAAVRAGSVRSEITLGGRRIAIRRLRARTCAGQEAALPSFWWAAARDPLNRHTMAAVAAGVSTRRYARTLDPLPAAVAERSTGKSAVSRRFIAHSRLTLEQWLARPLADCELVAVLLDGVVLAGRCVMIALGIDRHGQKQVLGLCEGTTENATVVGGLLDALIERGLDPEASLLFVIDGSKALRRAIRVRWGERALVQRCQVHKRRNVCEYLPEPERPAVCAAIQHAYDLTDTAAAQAQLEELARRLERARPGAASSLREGLAETLTVQRLGITGSLYRTLRSTNVIENLNGEVGTYRRNVKRWRDGLMVMRWVAAALKEAHAHFHRVRGHGDLNQLVAALKAIRPKELDTKRRKAA
jgi:transposase-like protein